MVIDSKSGLRGMLVDADTGKPIRWAKWADLDSGEYTAFRINPKEARQRGIPLESILYSGKTRLRWVPAAPRFRPSKPSDAESLDEARQRLGIAIPPVDGVECEEPGCHRLAEWSVAREQLIEPERMPDGTLAERAVMIGRHQYCSRHYRNPVQVSLTGVESEVEATARPQW